MKNYEFRSQSLKQKSILMGIKMFVIIGVSLAIYTLATTAPNEASVSVTRAANIFCGFWLYANLLQVKVEVQELFVQPFNIKHAIEFLAISLVLHVVSYII